MYILPVLILPKRYVSLSFLFEIKSIDLTLFYNVMCSFLHSFILTTLLMIVLIETIDKIRSRFK